MPSKYSSFDVDVPSNISGPFHKVSKLANLIAACLMCLFAILNILLLLIILTSHSFTIDPGFTDLLPLMDFLSSNLNESPIKDIVLANNMTCPQSYQLEALTRWPGTNTGRYYSQNKTVYVGECEDSEQENCKTVDSIGSQYLFSWNKENFCILRANDYLPKPYQQDCPSGYKRCSKYCVLEGQKCPITSVKIISKGSQGEDENEFVELKEDKIMVITRDPDAIVLFEIGASFYNKPCLQPSYIPVKEEGPLYPLLDIPSFDGCGIFGTDDSSVILDSVDIPTFLDDNKLKTVKELPLYLENESGSQVYLVSRPRINILSTDICQSIDTQNLSSLENLLGSFKKWAIGATIFPLIVLAAYSIYLVYLLFDEGLKKFYKKATKKWASWIFFTVCLVVIIAYYLYLSSEALQISDQQYYYASLAASNCFDNPKVSLALASFAAVMPVGSSTILGYASVMFWASISLYAAAAIIMSIRFVYKNWLKD